MTVTSRIKKKLVPLIIEPHPKDYTGFPFLTLVQYRKHPMLVVIDNMTDSVVQAYVLDLCGPEGLDEETILMIISEWFDNNKNNYPISIEFARRGVTLQMSKIYRTLNVEFISRIIGPINRFSMSNVRSVKRRRKKVIPDGVEVYESNTIQEEQI